MGSTAPFPRNRKAIPLRTSLLTLAALLAATGPALSVEIQSHRALYQLSLDSRTPDSNVAGAGGTMMFQWTEGCDGWTIEQRYRSEFRYADGRAVSLVTTFSSFETLDGTDYSYSLVNQSDGTVFETLRGRATLDAPGGTGEARYREPEPGEATLPDNSWFPTWHTIEVIERAMAGDVVFNAHLFDGTTDQPTAEVNAIIGPAAAPRDAETFDGLLAFDNWPIQMAYFESDSATGTPDYEVSINLFANGIADELVFDYGEFALRASLKELETVPGGC